MAVPVRVRPWAPILKPATLWQAFFMMFFCGYNMQGG
jgi:hypothetical protein